MFSEARQIATWHYQWIIVNEFLPTIVGSPLVSDILSRGGRFYRPRAGEQSIPVEFQGAAYRFGHSMVRPSYRANLAGDNGAPFFGFIFDPARRRAVDDPVDLRGGAARGGASSAGRRSSTSVATRRQHVRPNKIIDTKISTPLFNLPLGAIASGDLPTALPQRNLLRHLTWSIPSGQAIARKMGIRPLSSGTAERARAVRRGPRPQHAALVLRPQRGRARRRPAAGRRRRADRRRSLHRPAGRRFEVLFEPVALAADASQPRTRYVRDRRPPDVRPGGPGEPRTVSEA